MTTLTTFMLETASSAKSVNLVGSWDNFTKAYPMEKDPRRGRGSWRGCHTFENIVCDGEVDTESQKRDGALKMGGKYWYYYQMDQDVDFHNPAEPSTTQCPLLPGQPVNILDMPLEMNSTASKSRSGSLGSANFALDPQAKFMSPRPVPEPRSRSPSKASPAMSIRRGRTFDVADERSTESSSSTFTRLINKASISEGLRSRSGSPSGGVNLRTAMSLSNLKGAQAYSEHEDARDRKRLFQKLQKSSDRGREISRPLPYSQGEAPRSIGLAGLSRSAMSSRAGSRTTSRSASPVPSRDVASVRSYATGETAGYSPLRTYLADRSWENSPMPPPNVGGFPDNIPAASKTGSVAASQTVLATAREPSPLRVAALVQEDKVIDIPQETIEEAEHIDDDFNFRFEFEPVPSGSSSSSSGLSVPPSRDHEDTALAIPDNQDAAAPQAMTYMSPTFGSTSFSGTLPISLHLQLAHAQSTQRTSTIVDNDEENFPKSHFSMWSNSTTAMSPLSETSDSPGSPCFSSLTSELSAPLSPTSLSFRDLSLNSKAAEPAEFAQTSYRHRAVVDLNTTEFPPQVNDRTTEEKHVSTDGRSPNLPSTVSSTFHTYSLPHEKNSSQVTLRKPVPTTLDKTHFNESFASEKTAKPTWEEPVSSMDEMMRELGYLGEMITHH